MAADSTLPTSDHIRDAIAAWDAGNREPWGEILIQCQPFLNSVLCRYFNDQNDRDEVIGRIFERLSRHKPAFNPDRPLDGWLYTIARNTAYNYLKSKKTHMGYVSLSEYEREHDSNAALMIDMDPGADMEVDEEYAKQRRLSQELLEDTKFSFTHRTLAAFHKTAIEGKSAQEAGQELGMSIGAVYVAKSRVLKHLREGAHMLDENDSLPGRY